MAGNVIELTDADFDATVMDADTPVLVDFWAPWCGPCKMIGPFLDELALEYSQKLKICKINVDDSSQVATEYGIMSIPTLVFFKSGQIISQSVGALSKSELKTRIQEII